MLETAFSLASGLAVLGWLALILFPSRPLALAAAGLVVPLLFATAYIGLILSDFASAEGGFGSLAEVGLLFENPAMLLAGWLHYLAFDLFVGTWEVRTARREGIPHWAVVPCLIATFLLGPLGFFLFVVVRASVTGRFREQTT